MVTLPAAPPPAGREHLPSEEALISVVLRHTLSQHAQLHLTDPGEGLSGNGAQTFTPRKKCDFVLVFMPTYDVQRDKLDALLPHFVL